MARDQTARRLPPGPEGPDDQPIPLDREAAEQSAEAPLAKGPAPQPPAGPTTDSQAGKAAAPAKPGRRKVVLLGVGALAILAAAAYGTYYVMVGRFYVSTDDAYVRSNNSTLGSRVAGHIAAIVPADNSQVKAGDVLFRIDDGDYRIAVDSAKARIATQEATIDRIGHQVEAQGSAVDQAKAQLASAEAALQRTEADYARQQELNTRGFASRAVYETSLAGRDQAAASVQAAKAALAAAQDNVSVTKAQQAEARAQLEELKMSLARAQRDLDFTSVRAPADGIFANRIVNLGDFVQVGQRMANVVPLDAVFVDANFKETQLRRIKPGQPVTIEVDAHSGREIHGVVDSVSPAAGQVFTLLPPDNATGNFTKIVQRVPVRIRIPADVARENIMRGGMSVYVTIDTHDNASPATH